MRFRAPGIFGGGGSTTVEELAAHLPTVSGAPTLDPNDVVDGSATSMQAGRIRLTTKNAAVASRLPAAMAVWEITPILDMRGDSVDDAADLDLGDIQQFWLWADSTTAPTDLIIAGGFSCGSVAAPTCITGVALQAAAGRWVVHHCSGTGASYTAAAADSASTRGGVLQVVMGTAINQARVNAFAVDASKLPINVSTAHTSPGSFSSQNSYDRLWIGVGWATGTGGTPASVDIGFASLVLRPREISPSILPF